MDRSNMQVLFLVLSKVDVMPKIVASLVQNGCGDPTVLGCEGAVQFIAKSNIEPPPIFGVLRHIVNPDSREQKLLLTVIPDEKVDAAEKIIDGLVGGIDNPNTGIMFTLPITHVKGLAK